MRTGVFPARYDKGHGWRQCKVNQAQRWEVRVREKLVGRYATMAEATDTLRVQKKRQQGPTRRYRLGSRMTQT